MTVIARGSTVFSKIARAVPWWLALGIGVVCIGFGAVLLLRPFASLTVLIVLLATGLILSGIAELTGGNRPRNADTDPGSGTDAEERPARSSALWTFLAGLAPIVAGVLVLVVPGLTIGALCLIVGISLILGGLARAVGGIRGDTDERVAAVLFGIASVGFGLLALLWPDVTVLILAIVVGLRLIVFGIDQVLGSLQRRHARREAGKQGTATAAASETAKTKSPGLGARLGRWARTAGAALALVLAVVLLIVNVRFDAAHPQADAFYTPPAEVPTEPGQLLRSEVFERDVPAGATAWRILYTTTLDEDGTAAVASALVVRPAQPADGTPVVAWSHGTTGFAQGCAPSLLEHPFVAGAFPGLEIQSTLDEGWSIVATDYVGLGTEGVHPYLIGEAEGRSVLDAIRAAQQLDDADLGEQTVIWGHSQGGHAALWSGGLAADYAPELDIEGVVAMAPASNLPVLLSAFTDSKIGSVFGSFVIAAYAETYADVDYDDYVRPGARIMIEEMANRCLTDPSMIVTLATALFADEPVWSRDPGSGALGERAAANVPTMPVDAPLFIAQGEADTLVLPTAQADYVQARCDAGQELEYRTYAGKDHMGVVSEGSPLLDELKEWTAARFTGEPWATDCGN